MPEPGSRSSDLILSGGIRTSAATINLLRRTLWEGVAARSCAMSTAMKFPLHAGAKVCSIAIMVFAVQGCCSPNSFYSATCNLSSTAGSNTFLASTSRSRSHRADPAIQHRSSQLPTTSARCWSGHHSITSSSQCQTFVAWKVTTMQSGSRVQVGWGTEDNAF